MEPDDDPCKTPPAACSSTKSSPSSSSIHPEKEPSLKSSSTEDLPSGGESPQKSKEKTRSFIRKVDDKVSKWQQKLVCNLEHKLDRVKSMQTGSKFKSRRLTMNPSHHRRVRGSSDGDAMTSYSAVRTESQSSSSDTSVSVVPTPSLRLKEPSQEPPGEPSSSPADGETRTNETEQPIPEPPPRGQKMFSGLPRHMRSQRSGSITLAMLRSSQPSLRSNSFKRRRRLTSEKLSEDRSFDDDDDDEAADTVSLLLADEHDSNVDNGSEPEAVINSPVIKSSFKLCRNSFTRRYFANLLHLRSSSPSL
ncbi:unnamed protein product [Notodromas monacha]|uniref:Uncharacterized protein n=1 Tax=Notodromas monacha TaxID=399045 RepID=A0A7R9GIR4_9CRUS|nr:unnamed protein product [Notodromas monacha]CAG0922084.1 unnamed protein product [Notodromas monacha]